MIGRPCRKLNQMSVNIAGKTLYLYKLGRDWTYYTCLLTCAVPHVSVASVASVHVTTSCYIPLTAWKLGEPKIPFVKILKDETTRPAKKNTQT